MSQSKLQPHSSFAKPTGPVVLCILDGVGLGGGGEDDAVATARTPTLDRWTAARPFRSLSAHGTAVGLPSDSDMGNSEVGHNAIGAGRVVDQGAKLVDRALASGSAFQTPVWERLVKGSTLHLLGLLSDGNVHSHLRHWLQVIERAAADGVKRLRIHALTDGRDVPARSALQYLEPLQQLLAEHAQAGRDYQIASGGGRMHITMDRYQADWAMVERGWRCHVHAEGRFFKSAVQAVNTLYNEDPSIDDQWLPAFVIVNDQGPVGRIQSGDSVLLINFRGDRAIEISQAFESDEPLPFDRPGRPQVYYAGMMQYDGDLALPTNYLVQPPVMFNTVGDYLVRAGLRTFACAETQKFGHVTYFFNGNRSGRISDTLETYCEIPSDTLPFDERPWMKAAEVTDAVVAAIASGQYDHLRLNYANGDMVGHTGKLEPARRAVEAVDLQLARLEAAVTKANGVLLVTADHGNADQMYQRKGDQVLTDAQGAPLPRTAHSLNPVPLWVIDPHRRLALAKTPPTSIAAVGSTVLELCGLALPDDYLPGLVVPAR